MTTEQYPKDEYHIPSQFIENGITSDVSQNHIIDRKEAAHILENETDKVHHVLRVGTQLKEMRDKALRAA